LLSRVLLSAEFSSFLIPVVDALFVTASLARVGWRQSVELEDSVILLPGLSLIPVL